MSETGKLHSPEFKEVAIRLVHSSEDPHFSIRPHLRKGISNLANQVVGRERSVPESHLTGILQNALIRESLAMLAPCVRRAISLDPSLRLSV